MGEESSQGITRRDLLRRGAVLGGAVVWTTPVVQTLGMGRAFANTASPVDGCTPDVSFISMCVTCGTDEYLIKWERDGDKWDTSDPVCGLDCGTPVLPSDVPELESFSVDPDPNEPGCWRVTWSSNCTVERVAVFGGNEPCDHIFGPLSTGFKVCCPGSNPGAS